MRSQTKSVKLGNSKDARPMGIVEVGDEDDVKKRLIDGHLPLSGTHEKPPFAGNLDATPRGCFGKMKTGFEFGRKDYGQGQQESAVN